MSAGNQYFELGGISNISTQSGSGIQLAGLANIIGSNTFLNLTLKEERMVIHDGFSSDFRGIQFSGLLNYVRNNAEGFRFTGGFNLNSDYASGLQVAGLANMTGGHFEGLQIGGLSNVALKGMSGVQVAIFNHTNGQMNGFQFGVVNKSKRIKGSNSQPSLKEKGFQIGLVNISKNMDGFQLGLVNIGGKAKGTQIGLINIFKAGPDRQLGKNSTPIGLINIGSSGSHTRLYANELFMTVVERTSGSCYNCTFSPSQMPFNGRFKIMHQNALIFAYNLVDSYNKEVKWGFGYGFQKVLYNKSSMIPQDPKNHKRLISVGGRVLHLNRTENFKKVLSLLTTIHSEIGIRVKFIHLFAGLTLNAYLHRSHDLERGLEFFKRQEKGLNYQFWPGYTVGLHLF